MNTWTMHRPAFIGKDDDLLENHIATERHDKATSEIQAIKLRQLRRYESEQEDLREFFGAEADGLITLTLEVNVMDLLMAQRALAGLLPAWRVVREATYDAWRPALIEKHAVKVGPDAHDYVIKDGRQFWLDPHTGERLVLELEVADDPKYPFSEVRFRVSQRRHDWLCALIPQVEQWIDQHHFLRGQSLSAEGKIISFGTQTAWADVLLPEAARRAIEANCIGLLRHSALYRANGLPAKRGIILHGPPGTGKTMIGRALAQLIPATFIFCTPGMLEDAEDVRRVFEWGRRFAPSVLFFEDFDLIASERSSGRREMVGEFLNSLDGIEGSDGVIAIATTNDLRAIEPALKNRPNRFDVILEIPPLDRDLRCRFLLRWLRDRESCVNVEALASKTEGFTGAQLQELCRQATLVAIEQAIAAGSEPACLPLADAHFALAFDRTPARAKHPMGFRWDADEDNSSEENECDVDDVDDGDD